MIQHQSPLGPTTGTVSILGIPLDENSSYLDGPKLAPSHIRHVLHDGASNLCAENGLDLSATPNFADTGDLDLSSGTNSISTIRGAVSDLLASGVRVISLGGDHSVTYPIIQAYAEVFPDLNILHLDAHPDLYDEFEGNRLSHACPFARILENGLATRLVQVGIRTMNPQQKQQAERFKVEIIDMQHFTPEKIPSFQGPLYLSLDMDVLDPAFAPGISHHEPGGLSTRQVLAIIQSIQAPLVGADIVELNPTRDISQITARTAAKFLKEIAANMLSM